MTLTSYNQSQLQGLCDISWSRFTFPSTSQFKGFNAGFQGVDLSIYDNFLSTDRFQMILDLFDYPYNSRSVVYICSFFCNQTSTRLHMKLAWHSG